MAFQTTFRFKFITPAEPVTLDTMIEALKAEVKTLEEMKSAGVTVSDNSAPNDDYYFLETDDPEVAAKFNMEEPEDDEGDDEFDDEE